MDIVRRGQIRHEVDNGAKPLTVRPQNVAAAPEDFCRRRRHNADGAPWPNSIDSLRGSRITHHGLCEYRLGLIVLPCCTRDLPRRTRASPHASLICDGSRRGGASTPLPGGRSPQSRAALRGHEAGKEGVERAPMRTVERKKHLRMPASGTIHGLWLTGTAASPQEADDANASL